MKVQDNVMFTPIWTVPPYQDKSKTEINLQCTDLNVQGELFQRRHIQSLRFDSKPFSALTAMLLLDF